MGQRFTLRDNGVFWKICAGRNWVGRVYQNSATQQWHGHINTKTGKDECPGWYDTKERAFDETVAKHLGFSSADALRQQNANVRASNNAKRQHVNDLARRFKASSPEQQMAIMEGMLLGPAKGD